jgi:hypothetical protein
MELFIVSLKDMKPEKGDTHVHMFIEQVPLNHSE